MQGRVPSSSSFHLVWKVLSAKRQKWTPGKRRHLRSSFLHPKVRRSLLLFFCLDARFFICVLCGLTMLRCPNQRDKIKNNVQEWNGTLSGRPDTFLANSLALATEINAFSSNNMAVIITRYSTVDMLFFILKSSYYIKPPFGIKLTQFLWKNWLCLVLQICIIAIHNF